MKSFASLFFVATACAPPVQGGDLDPDAHDEPEMTVFEGGAVMGGLDTDGTSAPLYAEQPFLRLGLLWDGPLDSLPELRTSADGVTWSDWQTPEVTFAEEGAYSGRLDLSSPATHYQYRVQNAALAPTFVAFEAIAEVPTVTEAPGFEVIEPDEEEVIELVEEDGIEEASPLAVTTPIGSVRIHSRRSWNARSPNCISNTSPNRATIHHTVSPVNDSLSPQARLRQIQAFHMFTRGYCDIAYNYLISRDGRVWRGRGALRLGAHTENANTGNVGIAFIGTYTNLKATDVQKCRAAKLLAYLHRRFPAVDLNRTDVKGHRQYKATECPGNTLYPQLDSIVRISRNGCN